jgi:hypothetical protein
MGTTSNHTTTDTTNLTHHIPQIVLPHTSNESHTADADANIEGLEGQPQEQLPQAEAFVTGTTTADLIPSSSQQAPQVNKDL